MRDAARKYKRVVQMGTMNRSADHYQTAVEYVNQEAGENLRDQHLGVPGAGEHWQPT